VTPSIKSEAHRLLDSARDDASWEELAYLLYLHGKLERGRAESAAGKGLTTTQVRQRLGLTA
jgi:hypothetical protein